MDVVLVVQKRVQGEGPTLTIAVGRKPPLLGRSRFAFCLE